MCGICGQYSFYGELVLEERILKMMNSIVHRGPDDSGFYVSRQIGLGFRRLSIIDLSDGHQPMSDNEKRIWVVFNGEIYNFRELRTELEKKGHRFLTSSDTEVIVYGYKQWGADVLNRLNGMFGLAIWDTAQNRLIIARDPMGIKPVYYCNTGSDLFFGSEIRPIIAALGTCPEVDSVSLNLFLRYRYTPSPGTLYKDVFKLAAGEMIEVVNGKMDKRRWYNYVPTLFEKAPSITDAEEELFCLYRNAVKRQLISDVPVGILLSGGVDSGLLLALMSENGKNWPTFTVGYGKSYKDDELIDAKETADFYGASNEAVLIDRETFELELPQIISCLEEPVASSSVVPMYFVCQKARQDVKVALIGQGPDELFGGYSRHLGAQYGYILRRMPQIFQSIVSNLIYTLPRNEALKRAVSSLGTKDKFQRYRNIFSLLPGDTINKLFYDGLLGADPDIVIEQCWSEIVEIIEKLDEIGGLQLIELRSSLPDELLMYGDKLSMAHSLELRVPFLDKEIVEYAQKLDGSFKIRFGQRKWLHKRICRRFLPEKIIGRKKRGFGVNVVDEWFNHAINSQMVNVLEDSQSLLYKYLQKNTVQRLLGEHQKGRNDNHKVLFSLVVFELWLRQNDLIVSNVL